MKIPDVQIRIVGEVRRPDGTVKTQEAEPKETPWPSE